MGILSYRLKDYTANNQPLLSGTTISPRLITPYIHYKTASSVQRFPLSDRFRGDKLIRSIRFSFPQVSLIRKVFCRFLHFPRLKRWILYLR